MPLKKKIVKTSFLLTLICMLSMIFVSLLPLVNAQQQTMTLTPFRGSGGTWITAYGFGFRPNGQVTISVFTTQLAKVQASSNYGTVHAQFKFPSVAPGTYPITATDDEGNTASAMFTVTGGSDYTPPPTVPPENTPLAPATSPPWVVPTGTSTWSFPTLKPSQTPDSKSGGLSPELIGAIIAVAAVAIILPAFFLVRRRGGKEPLPDESPPTYKPGMPSVPTTPSATTRYRSPSSTFSASSRFGPSSSYDRQLTRSSMTLSHTAPRYGGSSASMRMCPRCKHSVRDYYSVCPYCSNKLK